MPKKRVWYYLVIDCHAEWGGPIGRYEILKLSPYRNSNNQSLILNLWDGSYLPNIIEMLEKQGLVNYKEFLAK